MKKQLGEFLYRYIKEPSRTDIANRVWVECYNEMKPFNSTWENLIVVLVNCLAASLRRGIFIEIRENSNE